MTIDEVREALNAVAGFVALVLLAMPFVFAIDAASASSKCAKLEDEINAIRGEDPGFMRAMSFFKYVKALNKDQGLGCVARCVHCLIA